jgi:ACS family tartrate transporter-like MFS transporter
VVERCRRYARCAKLQTLRTTAARDALARGGVDFPQACKSRQFLGRKLEMAIAPDAAVEKSAMRKIYLRLLPFAILCYILAYIDRINSSFAALTMRADLNMSAADFGFAVGTFYWAYFLFEVPSNVIMEKVGARIWIARIMVTWGIFATATAFVTGTTSFAILRFLLGMGEAASFPA